MSPRSKRTIFAARVIKNAVWKYYEDDGAFMARGLAFGLLIYCIPLALLTVSALSYMLTSSDRALYWIQELAQALAPGFQRGFGDYFVSIVSNRGVLGLAGFITFLFVSSTTFGSLRLVLNKVFRAPEPRGIIHGKAMEVVMMLATSVLFFVIIAIVYAIALFQSLLLNLELFRRALVALQEEFPLAPTYIEPTMLLITSVVSFVATAALFCFLYHFAPAKSLKLSSLLTGSLTAAILFELSKTAFGLYMRYAQGTTALYGALSGLVFFFLWVYYACVVFVLGAEVSWAVERGE